MASFDASKKGYFDGASLVFEDMPERVLVCVEDRFG